jgi:putative transcriptional regulator
MELDFNIFKIEYNKVAPQKGRVLVSEPFLQDTYFKRSIVLLTEYSDKGASGFVLNKPLNVKVTDIIPEFPATDINISIGGPVETNTLHFMHTLGAEVPNAVHVFKDIWWGGDIGYITDKLSSGEISSGQLRLFLGYSGWDAGQLENELDQNSWMVTEINSKEMMFPMENLWKTAMNRMGDKYRIWANFPENPSQN